MTITVNLFPQGHCQGEVKEEPGALPTLRPMAKRGGLPPSVISIPSPKGNEGILTRVSRENVPKGRNTVASLWRQQDLQSPKCACGGWAVGGRAP